MLFFACERMSFASKDYTLCARRIISDLTNLVHTSCKTANIIQIYHKWEINHDIQELHFYKSNSFYQFLLRFTNYWNTLSYCNLFKSNSVHLLHSMKKIHVNYFWTMKMNLVLGKHSKNVSYGLFLFGGKYRINYYIFHSYSKSSFHVV